VFSLAYVILPFSDAPPADAIRASLSRFQRGLCGDVPDEWLAFADETDALLEAHETRFTFTDKGKFGLRVEGGDMAYWHVATDKVQDEMRQRGQTSWSVRFADGMDLDAFFDHYGRDLERHPATGAYGRWRNPLGRWDWWDLGGGFDGSMLGERSGSEGRRIAAVSSGANPGRTILANVGDALRDALGEPSAATVDVRSDRNIELAATLLTDARAGRRHAYPAALVLPPGAVTDDLRWLGRWPALGPVQAFGWFGLEAQATWEMVVKAAYERFHDHWIAGVAYHH
jgi:hypothetical protein